MQTIDNTKVLLITNADIEQSTIDADDYVIKRGLNPAHRLSFSFGTTSYLTLDQLKTGPSPTCVTAPYTGQFFLTAIINYTRDHVIDAVILSTYTPSQVSNGFYTLSACAGMAFSLFYNLAIGTYFNVNGNGISWSNVDVSVRNTIENTINDAVKEWKPLIGSEVTHTFTRNLVSYSGSNYFYIDDITDIMIGQRVTGYGIPDNTYIVQNPTRTNPMILLNQVPTATLSGAYTFTTTNRNNPYQRIPHGRLGCPDYSTPVIAENPMRSSITTASVYTHAVTNALIAETQNHTNSLHALSQTLNYSIVTPLGNRLSYDWAKRLGMPNVAFMAAGASSSINGGVNFGVNNTQTRITVSSVVDFPESGVAQINGPSWTTLYAPVTQGDTTCQVVDKLGFVDPNNPTGTQNLRFIGSAYDNLSYNSITGNSSPYTIHFTSPLPESLPSGTGLYSRSLGRVENVSYTGLDKVSSPPALTGCIRADNDVSLQNAGLYALSYNNSGQQLYPPYSWSFVSGSNVLPIGPPGAKSGTYYLQSYGSPCIDPNLPAFFSLCIGIPFNFEPTIYEDLNGKVLNGAWGYTWTSSAGIFGDAFLRNGGSAAVFTYGEPFATGIPIPHQMFIYTSYYKLPLMLAFMLSHNVNQGSTVCGDPLYNPYLSTPTVPPVVSFNPYGM